MIDYKLKLEQLCKEKNMQYSKMSRLVKMSPDTMYRVKRSDKMPSLKYIVKVCDALKINLSDFFMDSDELTLTENQRDILEKWNKITEKQKLVIIKVIMTFTEIKNKKNENN